jgi:hypothetical protein
MIYDTFNFPAHTLNWDFPKGSSFRFGGGYTFTAKPQDPIQRTLKLNFDSMRWILHQDGTLDLTTDATHNLGALCAFYEAHQTYKTFIYPASGLGNLYAKFDAENPFQVPKPMVGGSGWSEAFVLQLIEQAL